MFKEIDKLDLYARILFFHSCQLDPLAAVLKRLIYFSDQLYLIDFSFCFRGWVFYLSWDFFVFWEVAFFYEILIVFFLEVGLYYWVDILWLPFFSFWILIFIFDRLRFGEIWLEEIYFFLRFFFEIFLRFF